jgi:hypothetical protein
MLPAKHCHNWRVYIHAFPSNPTFVFVKGGWTVLEDGLESNEQKRKSTI